MIKTISSKILWLARGTSMALGLAIMLAIVLGVGTTALAAVPGDPFRLGQVNSINNAITTLIGSRAGGAMMLVDNNSGAAGSRALDLRAEPGRAPLTVNAGAGKAPNLDADRLDGKDSTALVPTKTYSEGKTVQGSGGGARDVVIANCDLGDVILSGGYSVIDGDDDGDNVVQMTTFDSDVSGDGTVVFAEDFGPPSDIFVQARCADLPPLR